MSDRVIPGTGHRSKTHNSILDKAAELFALKGYGAVSMRDIAQAVGIKTSSLYNYCDGKEDLMEDILSRFEKGYRHYFDWLAEQNKKAESLDALMDNMFNPEFVEMRDPIGCLGMSLLIKEQHSMEPARRRVFELFYEHSISRLQEGFDSMAHKGLIPPSGTRMIATLFMFFVMVSNDIRLHEYAGAKPPLNATALYADMKNMIVAALTPPTGPGS
jgi:AcrR family transcriptional regulator